MHTRIKVIDLTLRQWDLLQDNLLESYEIPETAVRVCVEFELDAEMNARHVEMPVRAFMALMTRLQRIEHHAGVEEGVAEIPGRLPVLPSADQVRNLTAGDAAALAREMNQEAALPAKWSSPLSDPDRTCDHGLPVVEETPSAFEGGEPVRTFEDGCQSVGPYRPLGS